MLAPLKGRDYPDGRRQADDAGIEVFKLASERFRGIDAAEVTAAMLTVTALMVTARTGKGLHEVLADRAPITLRSNDIGPPPASAR